ncbi:MAG TPA: DUF58 domain-containing protein [Holophagaceae bacterium]|jgi:uncharacterized protein (DUF58 family)|nr:DUF58 domain-containing protein [Holophagaceae bacterium]
MLLWKDRTLRLSITRLGWEYLLALMLIGLFAVNSGNNLLYLVFSLMLGLFLVSGVVSRRSLRNLKPLDLDEGNLFARVRGGLRLRFTDGAPRRIRGLELRLAMEGGEVETAFFAGGGGDAEPVAVLHARAGKRGWTRLTGLELRTRHPFGFLEKAWHFELDRSLLVLPHPRAPQAAPGDPAKEGQIRTLPRPGDSSPEGARPMRPGDPPARVHWKRSAQRPQGELWVRTFEEEQPLALHLELDLGAWAPGRNFERELERLSGAILQARLQKREVELVVRSAEGLWRHEGSQACWRALAISEAEAESAGGPDAPSPATSGPVTAS